MMKWQWVKIGDICKTGAGGTPLKSHKEYYEGGNIPWLLSGEVAQGDIFESQNYITQKGLKNSSAKIFPVNTVLVAMYGATAGQVGILRFDATTNQAVCGILPNDKIIPEFLYYALLFKKSELIAKATGNAQPNISQVKIKNTKIPLISISEQQQIVEILDKTFEGIDRAIANTEKNLANTRELFESYLNAIFTQKGDDWVEKKFCEILKIQPRNGWSPPAKHHSDTGVPVLTLSSVTGFQFNQNKIKFTNASTKKDAHYWLNNGEFLITRSNTHELVGHVAICENLSEPTICCDLIIKMTIDSSQAYTRFIYWYFRTHKIRRLITSSAQGANPTMKKINKKIVQNLPVTLPKLSQQKNIAEKIDNFYLKTQRLEVIYQRKLEALQELKQSILHKAFTGELTNPTVKEDAA